MTDRRSFIATSIATLLATTAADSSAQAEKHSPAGVPEQRAADRAEDPRITRARLAGPEQVTRDATVAIMRVDGTMEALVKGLNEWVCVPGDLDKIGHPPMCMNPMGMQWMSDAMTGKPRPTNSSPGMLYGATQRSNTDPADKTGPAIPIGPHWMITWPFDARANGLPTNVRDRGAWVMFAGTPYSYLHVCGSPWDGNEYHEGDRAIWTMKYQQR